MSLWGGRLLADRSARKRELTQEWVEQEARDLDTLLEDAVKAQRLTKRMFAGAASEWASTDMNNNQFGYEERKFKAGPNARAPNGEHFDPGTKSRERIVEKARGTNFQSIIDMARLGVTFVDAKSLEKAVQNLLKLSLQQDSMRVVWVTNKFECPSCLGYRDLNIGLQVQLKQRKHIVEVQFNLKQMADHKSKAHDHYKVIRKIVADNVKNERNTVKVQRKIIRLLDLTDEEQKREQDRQSHALCELDKRINGVEQKLDEADKKQKAQGNLPSIGLELTQEPLKSTPPREGKKPQLEFYSFGAQVEHRKFEAEQSLSMSAEARANRRRSRLLVDQKGVLSEAPMWA
jgi:hypothetical protein